MKIFQQPVHLRQERAQAVAVPLTFDEAVLRVEKMASDLEEAVKLHGQSQLGNNSYAVAVRMESLGKTYGFNSFSDDPSLRSEGLVSWIAELFRKLMEAIKRFFGVGTTSSATKEEELETTQDELRDQVNDNKDLSRQKVVPKEGKEVEPPVASTAGEIMVNISPMNDFLDLRHPDQIKRQLLALETSHKAIQKLVDRVTSMDFKKPSGELHDVLAALFKETSVPIDVDLLNDSTEYFSDTFSVMLSPNRVGHLKFVENNGNFSFSVRFQGRANEGLADVLMTQDEFTSVVLDGMERVTASAIELNNAIGKFAKDVEHKSAPYVRKSNQGSNNPEVKGMVTYARLVTAILQLAQASHAHVVAPAKKAKRFTTASAIQRGGYKIVD